MKLFIKIFIAAIFLTLAISPFISYGVSFEVLQNLPPAGGITPGNIQNPAELVRYLYIFGLGIGGLLAFAMIVYAGVEWAISAGNVSLASEAKDRIQSAVIGLLLLIGAYLILYTINPNLVSLRNPLISPLPPAPSESQPPNASPSPASGGPTAVSPFGPPDPYAVDLAGYSTVIQNALKYSPFGSDIGNMDPEARQSLINMIECAAKVGGSVRVKSAYRPQAYQDHLKEIFCKYSCAFQGKDPETLHRQYSWVNYCSAYVNFPCTPGKYDPRYQSALDSISMEWSRHGPLYAPASSGSAHSNGCGVDMNVSGINPLNYGFMQPISKDDPVHFNHVFCPEANKVYNPACGPSF